MATYTITNAVLNNASLFDVFSRTGAGSGSGQSIFVITNTDGTVTTYTGSNLTWNGATASAGTLTSIVRRSSDGTIIYDQITNFSAGVNDSFAVIWNAAGQAGRAGYIFSGADTHDGSSGNDFFRGYNGVDTFNGGSGNDQIGYDNDSLLSGGGSSVIVNLSASTQMGVDSNRARDGFGNIDVLNSIEEARGGGGADFFFGSSTYNFFSGRGGADTYDGGNTVAFFNPGGTFPGTDWNWVDYRLDGGTSGINITLTNGTATPGIDGVGDTAGTGTDTFGATETFTNINAIRGSGLADIVNGNDFSNYFEGLSSADTFDGNGGSDRFSYSNEFRFGGSTTRGVIVNLSDSAVTVGGVIVAAHTGIDTFNGTTGFVDSLIDVEEISATNQADTVHGNQFDNRLFLLNGNDEAFLGRGFDYIEPGAGNDIIHGEAGAGFDQSYEDRDEVSYDDFGANGVGVYIDLNINTFVDPTGGIDTVTDIERLRGTSSADTLLGSDTANLREEMYRGLAGNDIIDGRNGYDIIDYSRDVDNGGTGAIIANLSTSAITVGAFTVQGGTVRDSFGATDSVFYIEGVRGTAGNDTMVGNAGNNQFRPIGGSDTIDGGTGLDTVEMYAGDVFSGSGAIVNLGSAPFVVGLQTVNSNIARGVDGADSTLVSIENVTGSSAGDAINGSEEKNFINGWFGDDLIYGNGGNDIIMGLQGANEMHGGDGFDTVTFMYDQTIDDYFALNFPGNGFGLWVGVTVNLGTNSAVGFDGATNILTTFEAVTGTFLNDSITGDGNDNGFRGLSGDDSINGAGGNDTVNYSPTNQDGRILVAIIGVNYSEPNTVRVNLTAGALTLGGTVVAAGKALDGEGGTDTLTSIENVTGSIGADFIAASLVSNVIDGWTGADTVVYAGVQGDYAITAVNGGWQVERIADPSDTDLLVNVETLAFTGGGTMSLAAQGLTEIGDGTDNEIQGVQGADTLDGGGGGDFIDGGQGADNITGGTGADELIGGDGNDVVDGGADNDTIIAGSGQGNDTYIGGSGADTAVYTSTSLGIVLDLDVPGNTGSGAGTATGSEIDTDQLTGIENVIGGQGDDSITGDGLDNVLQGVAGADQLFGEGGLDTLQGGSGNDSLQGGSGNDSLYGDSDDDMLKGGAGSDLIDGGANSLVGGDTADFSDATGSVVATLGAEGDAVVTASGIGTDTLMRIENLIGGSSNDTLTGNAEVNVLSGGGGADDLSGGDGNDTLDGGAGNDTLSGGDGDDTINYAVGGGADAVNGGAGTGDTLVITGTGGDDTLSVVVAAGVLTQVAGGAIAGVESATVDLLNGLSDTLDYTGTTQAVAVDIGAQSATGFTAVAGVEHATGGSGADVLTGNASANTLKGGGGNDVVLGMGGNDTLVAAGSGAGNDTYDGGTGSDTLSFAGGSLAVSANLATGVASGAEIGSDALSGLENITGGDGDDTLTGDNGANVLNGGAGRDTLDGLGGVDTADYSEKSAAVVLTLNGSTNASATVGGIAEDTIRNIENVNGGSGADAITGDDLDNTIRGNGGNDDLRGAAGNDLLFGNDGDDLFVGGAGADVFTGGAGRDEVAYQTAATSVEVDLALSRGLGGDAQGDLYGSIENAIGSLFSDVLNGDNADNWIYGLAGNDRMRGETGNDILIGGAGADILTGGSGEDSTSYHNSDSGVRVVLFQGIGRYGDAEGDLFGSIEEIIGSQFQDEIFGDNANNRLYGLGEIDAIEGDSGNDYIDGGDASDKLYGQDGNDTLIGGLGQDRLFGGAGADFFVMTSVADSTLAASDEIVEFTTAHGDKIDLQRIDANTVTGGDQAFVFIGNAAFSGTAGELHYVGQFLEGDVDGNGAADFRIQMNVGSLSGTDFVL